MLILCSQLHIEQMTSSSLRSVDRNIWVKETPFKSLGIEVGTRMTIIRLSGGRIALISPVKLDRQTIFQIDTLGQVKYIIAPNLFHHLFFQACQNIYPEAIAICAPGLKARIPQIESDYIFTQDKVDFNGEIEYLLLAGFPASVPTESATSNEIAFYHVESKTLILTDSVFCFDRSFPLLTQLFSRIIGCYQQLRPSISNKLIIKDKNIIIASITKLLQWDFKRVIMAHGTIVEENAKERLKLGYEWFLNTKLNS